MLPTNFKINLELPVESVNKILATIAKEPYIEIAELLQEIKRQADFQARSFELTQSSESSDAG
jgi:hypothetical protein